MKGSKQECLEWLEREDGDIFEVKHARKKRTLTQNSYYWLMCNKLARKLGMSDTELHKNMLREWGVFEVFSVTLHVPYQEYFRYCDELLTDYEAKPPKRLIKVYKGSSEMNRKEFTHLIQGMREECESQGIDVLTPEGVASLKW